jgi:hypothetical protein
MTEFVYREVNPSRSINGDAFPQGVIDFNFSTGQPTAWVPSKSYFRMTLELKGAADRQPVPSEHLAFADDAASCLFNNASFRAGGQDVSSIVNYMPQASASKRRLQRSGAWLNSIGKEAYMVEASFGKRQAAVSDIPNIRTNEQYERIDLNAPGSVDATLELKAAGVIEGVNTALHDVGLQVGDLISINGVVSTITVLATDATGTGMRMLPHTVTGASANVYAMRRKHNLARNKQMVLWQPPLGIFDHDEPMGSGDYRFSLNPNSNYKKACIETVRANLAVGVDYEVSVTDMRFYIATIKTSIPSGVEELYLMETLCQSKPVASGSTHEFTVPSSTRGIGVFVQAQSSGTNPLVPPTMFKCLDKSDIKLNSLQVTYANTTKPSTRWNSTYTNTENGMLQRYIDTQIESGLFHNVGGSESFNDYMTRGPLYYYSFDRDSEDRSTQVQVSVDYAGALDGVAVANLFIVAFYSRGTEITTNNGSVVAVRSLNL